MASSNPSPHTRSNIQFFKVWKQRWSRASTRILSTSPQKNSWTHDSIVYQNLHNLRHNNAWDRRVKNWLLQAWQDETSIMHWSLFLSDLLKGNHFALAMGSFFYWLSTYDVFFLGSLKCALSNRSRSVRRWWVETMLVLRFFHAEAGRLAGQRCCKPVQSFPPFAR